MDEYIVQIGQRYGFGTVLVLANGTSWTDAQRQAEQAAAAKFGWNPTSLAIIGMVKCSVWAMSSFNDFGLIDCRETVR